MYKKILVVDDDRLTRELVRGILIKSGCEVEIAEDGQQAIEMVSLWRPDLVIIDGLLPKVHGFMACKAIKAMDTPPKVIVLTGVYTKPTYKWEVKEQFGADDVMNKPVNAALLINSVREQLGEFVGDEVSVDAGAA